jgi:hypothetical protein
MDILLVTHGSIIHAFICRNRLERRGAQDVPKRFGFLGQRQLARNLEVVCEDQDTHPGESKIMHCNRNVTQDLPIVCSFCFCVV